MAHFELVEKYKDSTLNLIPTRATAASAGYDLMAAEDVIIPPYREHMDHLIHDCGQHEYVTMDQMVVFTKETKAKPTLVPTGVRCVMDQDEYLQIQARSSLPLKHWLLVANAPGIVDSDYAFNPDSHGLIYVQLINFGPWPIKISAGERIANAIILNYNTVDGDQASGERVGGFGSTGAK